MRIIVRRERPHPGAQLSLFEESDGWRYQAIATNTTTGQLAFLEARHRAHARVEDRIRHAKDTGLNRFPSREFTINQAWLLATQIAADLIAWTRLLAMTGDATVLATCEPKALRYRFLHVPARLTRSARRRRLRTAVVAMGHRDRRGPRTSPRSHNPPDQPHPTHHSPTRRTAARQRQPANRTPRRQPTPPHRKKRRD